MNENLPEKFTSPVSLSPATVQTVKNTVFKGATDAELQLFFHKCLSVGCHPLDQLVHPVKFADGRGGFTVTFITSIDLMRSKAEESEEYDGQDEPEFTLGEHEDKFEHPVKATVNVYRKGIDRPFVGVAHWSEFFPSDEKKQFQWKKMPRVMLAKCAEAQALRKAFPKKLNKLYADEEMHQAIKAASGKGGSGKPEVTDTVPLDAEIVEEGIIEDLFVKKGGPKNKPWTKYGIKIDGVTYSTFDKKLSDFAKENRGAKIKFTWKQEGKYQNIYSLELVTESEPEPEEAPEETVEQGPRTITREEFESQIATFALQAGHKNADETNNFIMENSNDKYKSVSDIPEDGFSSWLDMFQAEAESKKE